MEIEELNKAHSDEVSKVKTTLTEKYTKEINNNKNIYEKDIKEKKDRIEVLEDVVSKETVIFQNYFFFFLYYLKY